jgi:hypothetical protein
LDSLSQDHVGCCHKAPREILEEMLKTGLGGLAMRYLIIIVWNETRMVDRA